MRGSIRAILGLIITMGAVGGLDNPETPLLAGVAIAAVGLLIMASGVSAMKESV